MTSLFGSIVSIGESPLNTKVIYTGSTDGQVQVTRNGGTTWTNVTTNIAGVPPFTPVSTVSAVASRRGSGLRDVRRPRQQRRQPRLRLRERRLRSTLARDQLRAARDVDLSNRRASAVGATCWRLDTRAACTSRTTRGATWQSLNTNMPTVPVPSLAFQARDNSLVAGTYGRGIYILDDVGPARDADAGGDRTTGDCSRP